MFTSLVACCSNPPRGLHRRIHLRLVLLAGHPPASAASARQFSLRRGAPVQPRRIAGSPVHPPPPQAIWSTSNTASPSAPVCRRPTRRPPGPASRAPQTPRSLRGDHCSARWPSTAPPRSALCVAIIETRPRLAGNHSCANGDRDPGCGFARRGSFERARRNCCGITQEVEADGEPASHTGATSENLHTRSTRPLSRTRCATTDATSYRPVSCRTPTRPNRTSCGRALLRAAHVPRGTYKGAAAPQCGLRGMGTAWPEDRTTHEV